MKITTWNNQGWTPRVVVKAARKRRYERRISVAASEQGHDDKQQGGGHEWPLRLDHTKDGQQTSHEHKDGEGV